MISKELLSEVLGIKELEIFPTKRENYIEYRFFFSKNEDLYGKTITRSIKQDTNINIYELAHKCKKWASTMGYDLFSHRYDHNASYAYLDLIIMGAIPHNGKYNFSGSFVEEFEADTEPEAIFAACQWILDNKETK